MKQVSTNHIGLSYVVYGNGLYVAYGQYSDYGAVMSSEDGINWVLRNDGGGPLGSGLSYSVALSYTGGKFFAFGGFGVSAVSSNGINWTTFPLPIAKGAAYGASKYVAVVNDNYTVPPATGVFTSTDGQFWVQQQALNASLGDIAYGAGLFVAIGIDNGSTNNSGHIYTSSSGTNWTERSILGGRTISFCNSIFIVPFGAGTNLISANGIDWATINTGISNKLGKITYTHGMFLALAGPDSYDYTFTNLAASTNGTNWYQYSKELPKRASTVATDGTRLLTVRSQFIDVSHSDGFVYYTDPLVSLDVTNTPPVQVVLSGLVGRSYRIESTDSLTNSVVNNWRTNITLLLPSDPLLWTDVTATGLPQRFYRAVLLP